MNSVGVRRFETDRPWSNGSKTPLHGLTDHTDFLRINPDTGEPDAVERTNLPIEHQARYYQTFPQAGYLLPSDGKEQSRLQLQHELLKKAWDGKLIFAPISIRDGCSILDSGTGSAVWLLNLAHQFNATISLHGIDIEARLFPQQLPSNVNLSVESVLRMPGDWTENFDVVNQRLLISALRTSEWPVALSEIFCVLKPGGWVQLVEGGRTRLPGPKSSRHWRMLEALFAHKGLLLDCADHLPDLLLMAGFHDVRVEMRLIPVGKNTGEYGANARDNFMGVFRGMKTPVLKAGGLGFFNSEKEFDDFMDEMELEWSESTSATEITVVLARKPYV